MKLGNNITAGCRMTVLVSTDGQSGGIIWPLSQGLESGLSLSLGDGFGFVVWGFISPPKLHRLETGGEWEGWDSVVLGYPIL